MSRECSLNVPRERLRPNPNYSDWASDLRGRYWDRTSDLFGVNEALSP